MSAVGDAPRVLHSLPGRVRVHLPSWSGAAPRGLERRAEGVRGVRSARANAHTRNVLVQFESDSTDPRPIVNRLGRLAARVGREDAEREEHEPTRRPITETRTRRGRRARIAVRGLDSDPDLGRRVVERLEAHPAVMLATASLLTGRVLVELADDADVDFEDVAAVLAELEPPRDDSDEPPAHPLDPAPLIEGSAKLIGATLGLGLLAFRRGTGAAGPPVARRGPAEAAAAVGIVEGLPALTSRIEQALGHERKELLFGGVAVASLTFSGSGLGLALAAASAARLLTETLAKRAAYRDYEDRVTNGPAIHPGATVHLQAGDRVPLPGELLAGTGTLARPDGSLAGIAPGASLDPGARLYGGPFRIKLAANGTHAIEPRAGPPPRSILARYLRAIGPLSLGYAALTALLTRSFGRGFTALLLVNPRAALYGEENADRAASARVVRAGVTVIGSRHGRPIRRPDVLVVDSPRVLADGAEQAELITLDGGPSVGELGQLTGWIAAAAGSPWGGAFRTNGRPRASDGRFDGETAAATIDGERWSLGPTDADVPPAAARRRAEGDQLLALRRAHTQRAVGFVALRPRPAKGAQALIEACKARRVEVDLLTRDDSAMAASFSARFGLRPVQTADSAGHVRSRQAAGRAVAVLSDGPQAAGAFAVCDLAIARTSGRRGGFAARADLLAPGLDAVTAIIDAGARRDAAVRDSVGLSLAGNVAGGIWGIRAAPTVDRGSRATYLAALAAIGAGSLRLRGGTRSRSVVERLSDPMPERWGREPVTSVLRTLDASRTGLEDEQAQRRRREAPVNGRANPLTEAVLDQLRSPLTGFLVAGAGVSLALGATADVVMIAAVIALNAAVSAWQQRQAGSASEALEHMTARTATVLRDGEERVLPATELVPGDVLALAPGDRVAADARLIAADRLEVDEAALTGESLPVAKAVSGGTDASRVVLEGSDVTLGTARAVVVAVSPETRMGAMAAALATDESQPNPLDERLTAIVRRGLPAILVGGALVTAAGMLWGQPLLPQLALGASIAIAAVPEGLPLLAGVAEAGVAQRLARRRAVVSRLASVEALGRVDVACADKTGTMTEGRLAVELVVDVDGASAPPWAAASALRQVLKAAGVASPHPDAPDAQSHPTDMAVLEAALGARLGAELRAERLREEPFDPLRGFHATATEAGTYVKGAAEVLVPRSIQARADDRVRTLDGPGTRALLERADELAEQGFRVLMVAEGPPAGSVEEPRGLTALGFVCIRDPLRATVPAAVARCHAAGVRVMMLTGDHPSTAAAIARQAGLATGPGRIVTGAELADLEDEELRERLDAATVVARSTPLDKLRIVEALQHGGHVLAMTGDGVNDAPALRLADVGVAMGGAGTEVARHAADVVVTDDDFTTLVEALVEGRSFWRNMRQALGLLLGGNLGEVGLMVAAGVGGMAAPMTARQILAVNLVTDVLPAVAVAVQRPEHRNLAGLRREGTEALDSSLRGDVVRRGVATAVPSFGAYALASRLGPRPPAKTVAFASVVSTQLGQTIDLGLSDAGLGGSVLSAVAASYGVLAGTILLPPARGFLGFALPTPLGVALVAGATIVSVGVSRALPIGRPRDHPAAVAA